MKLYTFYYKDKGFDISRLYAFTTKKKLAREFKSQRDMSKFTCTIRDDITDEDYTIFKSKYGNLILTYGSFYTKTAVFGTRIPVKVVCTLHEEESVICATDRFWGEYTKCLFDCKTFKAIYLQALESLLFIQFYTFYRVKSNNDIYRDYFYGNYCYNNFGPPEGLIMDDFSTRYSYDELTVFLKYYRDTFRNMHDN